MVRLGGNIWEGTVPTLRAEAKRGDAEPHLLIIDGTRVDDVRVYDDDMTPCLKNRMGTGGNNVPIIAMNVEGKEVAATLRGFGHGWQGQHNSTHAVIIEDTESVLAFDGYNQPVSENIYRALRIGIDSGDHIQIPIEGETMQVRRLTPVECERLMGWPDNYTLHRADGKTNSDTTRYKMCGNGVASPVAQWIAEQINLAENGL